MTVEQEIQGLINKYSKQEVLNAVNNFVSNEQEKEQKENWNHLAPMYGLPENLFNSKFQHNGRTFFLKDIKPRNRKYPILANREDGRTYKLPVDLVKSYFRLP